LLLAIVYPVLLPVHTYRRILVVTIHSEVPFQPEAGLHNDGTQRVLCKDHLALSHLRSRVRPLQPRIPGSRWRWRRGSQWCT